LLGARSGFAGIGPVQNDCRCRRGPGSAVTHEGSLASLLAVVVEPLASRLSVTWEGGATALAGAEGIHVSLPVEVGCRRLVTYEARQAKLEHAVRLRFLSPAQGILDGSPASPNVFTGDNLMSRPRTAGPLSPTPHCPAAAIACKVTAGAEVFWSGW